MICNKNFYKVKVIDTLDNLIENRCLTSVFEKILNVKPNEASVPLGSATSLNRNEWANLHDSLISTSEKNKQSLEDIQSAIFVLSLDTDGKSQQQSLSERSKTFLCGQAGNRWLDKSFNLIVDADGYAGLSFEHSWGDGICILR